MKPLLSVIIRIKNTPVKFVEESISSAINQNNTNPGDYEIILVIDKSSFNYDDFVKDKFKSRTKIHLYKNTGHTGLGNAMNFGISKAKGEYFCILDSDDLYINKTVCTLIKYIKSHKTADILFADFIKVSQDLSEIIYRRNMSRVFTLHKKFKFTLADPLLHFNLITGAAAVKRQVWKKIRYHNSIPEDWGFYIRAAYLKKAVNLVHIPESLYLYRYNPLSMSNTNVQKNRKRTMFLLEKLLPQIGFEKVKAKFFSRVLPTHSSYYNLYQQGKLVSVPWMDLAHKTIRI